MVRVIMVATFPYISNLLREILKKNRYFNFVFKTKEYPLTIIGRELLLLLLLSLLISTFAYLSDADAEATELTTFFEQSQKYEISLQTPL